MIEVVQTNQNGDTKDKLVKELQKLSHSDGFLDDEKETMDRILEIRHTLAHMNEASATPEIRFRSKVWDAATVADEKAKEEAKP